MGPPRMVTNLDFYLKYKAEARKLDPNAPIVAIIVPSPCPDEECSACNQQWRRVKLTGPHEEAFLYMNILSRAEAEDALRLCIDTLDHDHQGLRDTLLQYGHLVFARWMAGGRASRASFINTALPGLCKESCPMQRLVASELCDLNYTNQRKSHLDTLLIPYFNMEMLLRDPLNLLRLLHFRTTHHYRDFAMLDAHEHEVGYDSGFLGLDHYKECVDMTPTTNYGRIVPFDQVRAHEWTIVGCPRAKLILDSQMCLYRKLKQLVQALIDTKSEVKSSPGQWNDFVAQEKCGANSQDIWTRFSHRPYMGPPVLDYDFIVESVTNRRKFAEDHMELLLTDSLYMREAVTASAYSKTQNAAGDKNALHNLLEELWITSLGNLTTWRLIENECQILRYIAKHSNLEEHDGKAMSGTLFGLALCSPEELLSTAFRKGRKWLHTLLSWTRSFEKHYKFERQLCGFVRWEFTTLNKSEQFKADPLHYSLYQLAESPDYTMPYTPDMFFSMFETQMASSNKAQTERVDQRISNHISELAAVYEIQMMIGLQRPLHCCQIQSDSVQGRNGTRCQDWWARLETVQIKIDLDDDTDLQPVFERLIKHILALGAQPDKTSHTKRLKADISLHAFGLCAFRRYRISLVESGVSKSFEDNELSVYSYLNDEEYLAFIESQKRILQEKQDQIEGKKPSNRATQQPEVEVYMQTEWGESKTSEENLDTGPSVRPKKKKTRAATSESPGEPMNIFMTATSDHVREPIIVAAKRSTCEILAKMFADPTQNAIGTLNWQAFVNAMADAGFLNTANKGRGSAVTFYRPEVEKGANDAIVFHRPHPKPELGSVLLRSMGKRLHKWFGWTAESFVTRNDGTAES